MKLNLTVKISGFKINLFLYIKQLPENCMCSMKNKRHNPLGNGLALTERRLSLRAPACVLCREIATLAASLLWCLLPSSSALGRAGLFLTCFSLLPGNDLPFLEHVLTEAASAWLVPAGSLGMATTYRCEVHSGMRLGRQNLEMKCKLR